MNIPAIKTTIKRMFPLESRQSHSRPILITGANGGIGSELVTYLLAHGYENIVCQYHNESNALKTIFGDKFNKHCYRADLTKEAEVVGLHQMILGFFGHVWGLINLAGTSTNSMSWKTSLDEFTHVINANLLTTFLTCREFIPEMRKQEQGRIINTSSVVAYTGAVGAAHYCAAKAGILGLTKALALELANKNITVNVMALGYFDRGLIEHVSPELQCEIKLKTPLKRFGRVDEIGGLINYLLSEEGAFMTGQVHHINGGIYL